MKSSTAAFLLALGLTGLSSVATAATVHFNSTECPSCTNVTPVVGNEWSSFGLSVTNAYWYTDSRDTFDQMGLSINRTGTATIGMSSTGVTFDWWVISGHLGTYEAFDSSHSSLGVLNVNASSGDQLGTQSFSGAVSSLEWTGDAGFAQVSTVTTNPIPEPETYAMLLAGLGLLGFAARRRKLASIQA